MVILEVDNIYLPVERSQLAFNITMRSTFFGANNSFVFNFPVPHTDVTARMFEFPLKLNRLKKEKAIKPGSIIVDGTELARGTWQAVTAGERHLQLSFDFVADDFSRIINNKSLPDIFDEIIEPADLIPHVEATVLLAWPATEYQFPSVFNPDFYDDKNPAFLHVINNFEESFINDTFNQNTIIPMLYLPAIIKRIFAFAGYTVQGAIFEDEIVSKTILYNNHALDYLYSLFFSGSKSNATISTSTSYIIVFDTNIQDDGDNYNETTGKYAVPGEGTYLINAVIDHEPLHTPSGGDKYRVEIIHQQGAAETVVAFEEIVAEAGFEYNTQFNVQHAVDASLGDIYVRLKYWENGEVRSGRLINGSVEITNEDERKINVYQQNFNLKNHVLNYQCLEFLDMFYSDYQVFPVFDKTKKTVILKPFSDLLKSKPQYNLSQGLVRDTIAVEQNKYNGIAFEFETDADYYEPDRVDGTFDTASGLDILYAGHSVFFITSLNAYYSRVFSEENDAWHWVPLTDKNDLYLDGEGEQKQPLHFAPAVMRDCVNRSGRHRSMPAVMGAGTSHAYQLKNDYSLRVMVYAGYGVGAFNDASRYPFATTSKYDTQGNIVLPYNYFAAEIAARFWGPTIAWLKTRFEIEFKRRFTPIEIKKISMENKQMLLDSTIIVEELFAPVDPDLKEVTVKAWSA